MSQDLAIDAVPANATTLVLVVPTPGSDAPLGADLAGALERAARALRGNAGLPATSLPPAFGAEAALMRRVEAEVYGTD